MKQKRSVMQKVYLMWLILLALVIAAIIVAALLLPYFASHNISSQNH